MQLKRKFWHWMKNEDEGVRTLYLYGEISDETWYGDEVTPKMFKKELESGAGNVTVKVDALADSAASVIAMAGTAVQMSPVATMMIHNPMTVAIGDPEEMKKASAMLDEVKKNIMNAYEIKSWMCS